MFSAFARGLKAWVAASQVPAKTGKLYQKLEPCFSKACKQRPVIKWRCQWPLPLSGSDLQHMLRLLFIGTSLQGTAPESQMQLQMASDSTHAQALNTYSNFAFKTMIDSHQLRVCTTAGRCMFKALLTLILQQPMTVFLGFGS